MEQNPSILFSFLGLLLSFTAFFFLIRVLRMGPEAFRNIIIQLILGIGFTGLAFLWDIIFEFAVFGLLPQAFDFHHFFMAVSIFFFANVARHFYTFGK